MLNEAQGCAVLSRVFKARGYVIAENVPFSEAGVDFEIDGWDANARVGFEYLTEEAGDHQELDETTLGRLERAMEEGSLFVFLIDESEGLDERALSEAAEAFLDRVEGIRAASGVD